MEKYIQMAFRENPKMYELLKTNSYYYKELNRGVLDYNGFNNLIKKKYGMRTSDKLNKAIEQMEFISNLLNVLK